MPFKIRFDRKIKNRMTYQNEINTEEMWKNKYLKYRFGVSKHKKLNGLYKPIKLAWQVMCFYYILYLKIRTSTNNIFYLKIRTSKIYIIFENTYFYHILYLKIRTSTNNIFYLKIRTSKIYIIFENTYFYHILYLKIRTSKNNIFYLKIHTYI